MATPKSLTAPTKNKDFQFHPSQLTGKARADHVIIALLEYNKGIIDNNPVGANLKFQLLKKSSFIFMRGTADLMYRDLRGTDADKTTVLCLGDVHLENYGVMEADDGSLVWGLNDFDEAHFAPFTWDVKRGATSVFLAARDMERENPFSKKKARRLAQAFAQAYFETVKERISKKNLLPVLSRKNSPKAIVQLLKNAAKVDGEAWLNDKYLDPDSPAPPLPKNR